VSSRPPSRLHQHTPQLELNPFSPFSREPNRKKTQTLTTFILILNSTKSSDVANIVKGLTQQEQDGLMKFVYKVRLLFLLSHPIPNENPSPHSVHAFVVR